MRISAGRQNSSSRLYVEQGHVVAALTTTADNESQAEESSGFLDALLNILEAEQDGAVRLSGTLPLMAWFQEEKVTVSD